MPVSVPSRRGTPTRESKILSRPTSAAKARSEEPEHGRGVGEKRPAVAIGAEEGKKREQRNEARFESARQPPAKDERHGCRQQRVDHARPPQAPQRPVSPPIRRRDALPEEQRRFRVAQFRQLGLERQPVSARRGHARDVLVGIFVAVLRDVLTVETVEIREQRQDGCEPVQHQEPARRCASRSRPPCWFGRQHLPRFGEHVLGCDVLQALVVAVARRGAMVVGREARRARETEMEAVRVLRRACRRGPASPARTG